MPRRRQGFGSLGVTPLGITARPKDEPRTGHLYVPWEASEAIADAFLDYFDDYCTDGRIKPPSLKEDIASGQIIIPDAATGQPVPIKVILSPKVEAFHETSLPATGLFNPNTNSVYISPTVGSCKSPESWRNILLSVIRHELAHASDPGLYRKNAKLTQWGRAIQQWLQRGADPKRAPDIKKLPKGLRPEASALAERLVLGEEQAQARSASKSFCEYVQTPTEENAFLTQVASELRLIGKRMKASKVRGFKSPVTAIRDGSPTFREIEHCLRPEQRKRFLKTAARLWDAGDLPRADAPLGSHVRSGGHVRSKQKMRSRRK